MLDFWKSVPNCIMHMADLKCKVTHCSLGVGTILVSLIPEDNLHVIFSFIS